MHHVEIEKLLEAGAHFGHLTRRWNPKMEQFIFNERNGIHIIDLRKTQVLLDIAREVIHDIATQGKVVLFVGTKTQIKETVEDQAKRCEVNYVTERWLGGMLTNFQTIRKSIKRLEAIDKMEVDGTFEKITKKERLMLGRERERLRKFFGGIEQMTKLPGALFVVDIKKEHIAVKEANILGIPVIAIVDTNCDPEMVDYPIPANDDSIKTVNLISGVIADAIKEGSEVMKVRKAEMAAVKDIPETQTEDMDKELKIKRKMRERRKSSGQSKRKTSEPKQSKEDQPAKDDTGEKTEDKKPEAKEKPDNSGEAKHDNNDKNE